MIDLSVYPDEPHADTFADDFDRADYVDRICSAWDFGVQPEPATIDEFAGWRDIFDRFPIAGSPSYHAFRAIYAWPAVAVTRTLSPSLWEIQDAREERSDPCAGLI